MIFKKIEAADVENADQLFRTCMADLLAREGFNDNILFEEEVRRLNNAVTESFKESENRFYLALQENQLIGTIALQTPGNMLKSMVDVKPGQYEVACVYVHPSYQRQGAGDFLFQNAIKQLNSLGKTTFYLDAGFSSSQLYWLKKLGEPSLLLEDYWGTGKHHLVWIKSI
ncbi:GNAT family N-acetyltransferase [Planococcus shenhongbingii]|uniref:GNAT family N-acetyltransferase n=1 Tax=Planococcus shenhongbingii TaxID=3058398 RepID=A0ABT8NGH2_9BACL|nr:GNAT family N-acetyltransferase [Planococcus sp. N017]MDN7246984.1 GNAT family N-acetyltransferase [Planococcus sp. N017]